MDRDTGGQPSEHGLQKSVLACMGGVVLAGVIMGTLSLLGVSVFGTIG